MSAVFITQEIALVKHKATTRSSQCNTFSHFGDTAPLSFVVSCLRKTTFVDSFLRGHLFLGLLVLVLFLDTRVAHVFPATRGKTLVFEDGSSERTWTIGRIAVQVRPGDTWVSDG